MSIREFPGRITDIEWNQLCRYGLQKAVDRIILKSGSEYQVIDGNYGNIMYSGSNYDTVRNSMTGSLTGLVADRVGMAIEGYENGTIRNSVCLTGSLIYSTLITTVALIAPYVTGSIIVSGSNVYGENAKFTNITGSQISISGNAYVDGTISGSLVSDDVTAESVTAKYITGSTLVSGSIIAGQTGNIVNVNSTSVIATTVTGSTLVSGSTVSGRNGNFTNINATNITGSVLSGSNIYSPSAKITNVNATNITGSFISGSDIRSPTATITNLNSTNITGSVISGSNIYGPNAKITNVNATNITGSILSGSNIYGPNATITTVNSTNVTGSNIVSGSNVYGNIGNITNINATNVTGSNIVSGSNVYGNIGNITNINATNVTGSNIVSGSNIYGTFYGTLTSDICDYIIKKNEILSTEYYYAYRNNNLIYGGPDNEGDVTGSLFSDIINQCLIDIGAEGGGTIYLDADEFTSTKQIVLPTTITTNEGQEPCIEIRGTGGTVIKVDENLASHAIYCDSNITYYVVRLVGFDIWHHNKDEDYYGVYLKDVRQVYIRDLVVGWSGIFFDTALVVHITNLEVVDSPNEGIKINGGGYFWGTNIFLDNCGGNPLIPGYSSFDINGTSRLEFSNLHIYGEKGNYGGQGSGLHIYNSYSGNFSNLHIQGFKSTPLAIVGCHDLTFTGLHLNEVDSYSDNHALEILSYTDMKSYNISISDFNIYSKTLEKQGIGIYAQSGSDIYDIQICNGKITSAGIGISISDDTEGAVCKDISICNVCISGSSHGILEGGGTDYCIYTAINARHCPDGIYMTGSHSKLQGSWNYTTWVPYTEA